jgi:serine protease Do
MRSRCWSFSAALGIPVPPNMPRQQRPDRGEEEVPRGVGSGFIVSGDGFVMTNAHVVEGADEVIVTLTDKREFKARIVGADKRTDVAVVKIEATGLPSVKMGDINRVRVGEWVMAIGSPFWSGKHGDCGHRQRQAARHRRLPAILFRPTWPSTPVTLVAR